MTTARRVSILAAVLAGAVLTACSTPSVNLHTKVAYMDFQGDFGAAGEKKKVSTTTDTDALGIEEEMVFLPRLDVDWDDLHLGVHLVSSRYDGKGTTESKLELGNNTIEADTPVSTALDLGYMTVDLVYDVLPTDYVDVGVGLGLGVLWYDIELQSRLAPVRIDDSGTIPIGYLTVRAAKQLGPVSLLVKANWAAAELQFDDISYLELDGEIGYCFVDEGLFQASVFLGYRYINGSWEHDANDGTVDLDVTLTGPSLGLSFGF
jgi:hypothetical protein